MYSSSTLPLVFVVILPIEVGPVQITNGDTWLRELIIQILRIRLSMYCGRKKIQGTQSKDNIQSQTNSNSLKICIESKRAVNHGLPHQDRRPPSSLMWGFGVGGNMNDDNCTA